MCGLVGVILKAQNGACGLDTDLFEQLLYIDALRGDDSTGLASFHNDGRIEVLKESTTADYFRCTKEFDTWRNQFINNGKAVIGHNRKKTIGQVSDVTAHPFVINDRYVFTHNGTLTNHYTLKNNLNEMLEMGVKEFTEPDTGVDSEILGTMICPFGDDHEKLGIQLGKVDGAYACVWIDQEKEKLYLLRNKERPLFIANTSAGYIYSSEPLFIYAIAARCKVKVEDIQDVPPDELFSIELNQSELTIERTKLVLVKKSQPTKQLQKLGGSNKNKSTATGQVTTFGASKLTLVDEHKGGASKQAYKRFRNKFLNQRILFWIDDYVNRDLGTNSSDNLSTFYVTGQSDDITERHQVSFIQNQISEDQMLKLYFGELASGLIDAVVYNEKTQTIEIQVTRVKLIPRSSHTIAKEEHAKNQAAVH